MPRVEFEAKTNEALSFIAGHFGKTANWVIERAKVGFLVRGDGEHLLAIVEGRRQIERGEWRYFDEVLADLDAAIDSNEPIECEPPPPPPTISSYGVKFLNNSAATPDDLLTVIAAECGRPFEYYVDKAVQWYATNWVRYLSPPIETAQDYYRTAFADEKMGRTRLRKFLLALGDREGVVALDCGEAIDIEAKLAEATDITKWYVNRVVRSELRRAERDLGPTVSN